MVLLCWKKRKERVGHDVVRKAWGRTVYWSAVIFLGHHFFQVPRDQQEHGVVFDVGMVDNLAYKGDFLLRDKIVWLGVHKSIERVDCFCSFVLPKLY